MDERVTVDDGVPEWEAGLPSPDDLTPLSQSLIPAILASAFKISPDPPRTAMEIDRASQNTLSSIRVGVAYSSAAGAPNFNHFGSHAHDQVTEETENEEGSDHRRSRLPEQGSDLGIENGGGGDDQSGAMARSLKRPRLVWTPQLHKRFVDVVGHLGLKNAVPKTIMQLMNVEGLTRENVASHLQKYRLYVKRMQGLSNEGPSPSDHLFASAPVPPQSFIDSSSAGPSHGNGISSGNHSSTGNASAAKSHVGVPIRMPYPPPPPIMPIPMMGMPAPGHGYLRFEAANPHHNDHYHQQYINIAQHQRDWSTGPSNGYSQGLAHNNSKC